MEFENCLQQLHRNVLETLLAKWTADEETWLPDNSRDDRNGRLRQEWGDQRERCERHKKTHRL